MARNKINFIFLLFIFLTPLKANAFFKGILSPPCGCGWFQAGRDATIASRDDIVGRQHFQHCLACGEVKEFSDIAPYLRSFINQLPETKYQEYIQLLRTARWPLEQNRSYADVMLENAERVWHYSMPTVHEPLAPGEDMFDSGKKIQGPYKSLWKFLYKLSRY
jgi:hypothetical protein